MLRRMAVVMVVFALCVVWFHATQADREVLSKHPKACEVNHQPFGYAMKYRYTPDSFNYIMLASGGVPFKSMMAPYKYRVLFPMSAAALTLVIPREMEAMEAVTLFGLWAFYVVTAWTLFTLGVGFWPVMAGFVGVLSFWHVYLYQNPWSPDGLYLMFAALMILAAAKRQYWLFLACLLVGLTNKETILFLAPLWFAVDRKVFSYKAWIAVALGSAMYLLPRVQDLAASGAYLDRFVSVNMMHNVLHFPVMLLTVLWAWGLIWIISVLGIVKHRQPVIIGAFCLLGLGALVSCVAAADHGRMMASMAPAVFPATALFFQGAKT